MMELILALFMVCIVCWVIIPACDRLYNSIGSDVEEEPHID